MWIWKQKNWPNFSWDNKKTAPLLRQVQLNQGILLGKMETQNNENLAIELDTLLTNILNSYAIEGEKLNAFSVRSSLANKLGITQKEPYPTSEVSNGVAAMIFDAIHNLHTPLTSERLFQWHYWLFPNSSSQFNHLIAGELRGPEPMQVVSGRLDRPTVHFEAPPRTNLEAELNQFIAWFNHSQNDPALDPLLRSAICHLWFVTLHPFDDGNGRITRALTDLTLAQGEKRSIRFYAMSVAILEKKKSYYDILEQTQKGQLNITDWIIWFLTTLDQSIISALNEVEQT